MDMFSRSGLILLLAATSVIWTASVLSAADAPGQVLGGSLNSPVRIEVFSDFQCSACREFYLGTIRQVLQEYSSKDKVCIVYHEFPLAMHRYSRNAAQYAEAAARMGVQRLLPVMDSLFMDQAKWSQDGMLEASISKALPHEDFLKLKKIMESSSIDQAIENEIQLGMKQSVKSTPTIFISYSGKQQKVEGLVTYLVLKQFIDTIVK
jgi:protein-disulfide isomerase